MWHGGGIFTEKLLSHQLFWRSRTPQNDWMLGDSHNQPSTNVLQKAKQAMSSLFDFKRIERLEQPLMLRQCMATFTADKVFVVVSVNVNQSFLLKINQTEWDRVVKRAKTNNMHPWFLFFSCSYDFFQRNHTKASTFAIPSIFLFETWNEMYSNVYASYCRKVVTNLTVCLGHYKNLTPVSSTVSASSRAHFPSPSRNAKEKAKSVSCKLINEVTLQNLQSSF